MTVLVAFASAHGSTQGIAERIASRLVEQGVEAVAMAVETLPAGFDSGRFTAIIIGSAIQNGSWLPAASSWARANARGISAAPCWMFSVSTVGDQESAFPAALARLMRGARKETSEITGLRGVLRARGHRNFAGVIDGAHWGLPGRVFMAILRGKRGDHRNWPAIDTWADEIAAELRHGSGPKR